MPYLLPSATDSGVSGSGSQTDPFRVPTSTDPAYPGVNFFTMGASVDNPDPEDYRFSSADLMVKSSDQSTLITDLGQPSWLPGYEGSIFQQRFPVFYMGVPADDTTIFCLYMEYIFEHSVMIPDDPNRYTSTAFWMWLKLYIPSP